MTGLSDIPSQRMRIGSMSQPQDNSKRQKMIAGVVFAIIFFGLVLFNNSDQGELPATSTTSGISKNGDGGNNGDGGFEIASWDIGHMPNEQVSVSANWDDGKLLLTVRVVADAAVDPCHESVDGCSYRLYVRSDDEITGGDYLDRDSDNALVYEGSLYIFEAGSADSQYYVEVLRLRRINKEATRKWKWDLKSRNAPHSLYQEGVVVTERNARVPIGKMIRETLPKRVKELKLPNIPKVPLAIDHTVIDNGAVSTDRSWLRLFAKMPACKFQTNGVPAWDESKVTWVKKQHLINRGILEGDLLSGEDSKFIWFPRTCRLFDLSREDALKRFGAVGSEKGSQIVLIGTSRIRHVFDYLPPEYGIGSQTIHLQSEVEKGHDAESDKHGSVLEQPHIKRVDPRHQDKYYALSKTTDVTLVWAANPEAKVDKVTELIDTRPPLQALCTAQSELPASHELHRVKEPELFIGVSLGAWEVRYDNDKTYEDFFDYYDGIFSHLRSRCGPKAHLFLMSQPDFHIWSRYVKVPKSTKNQPIDLHAERRESWKKCIGCGETTSNTSLMKSQLAAIEASKKYDMVFVDFHALTKSLRRYSKDSLHYLGTISISLINLLMNALVQQPAIA